MKTVLFFKPMLFLLSLTCFNTTHSQSIEHFLQENVFTTKNLTKSSNNTSYLLDSIHSHKWDNSTNVWMPDIDAKYIFTHDNQGNRTTHTMYLWDYIDNSFTPFLKHEYEYNSQNILIKLTRKNWNSSHDDFINYSKQEYFYNTSNLLEKVNIHYWDIDTNNWELTLKDMAFYDSSNYLINRMIYFWETSSETWEITRKIDYVNDANGNKLERWKYNWNPTSEEWENDEKYLATYNAINRLLTRITFDWDEDGMDWNPYRKVVYSHDTNNNISQFIMSLWDESIDDWNNSSKYVYFWNLYNLAIKEQFLNPYKLYPNPVSSHLLLDNPFDNKLHIYITNGVGAKVIEISGVIKQIDVSNLPNGIYFVTIFNTTNGEKSENRIIKQ